jgi:hypothetical protein
MLERVIAKTAFTAGCWEFQGNLIRGYGQISKPGRRGGAMFVHRFSWETFFGPVPDGLKVLHKCDNPKCWRPSHLFVGTNAENTADMLAKGRHQHGDQHWTRRHPERAKLLPGGPVLRAEEHGMAKLTWEYVKTIRERYATGTWTYRSLAEVYGVTPANIRCIVKGWTWKEEHHRLSRSS